MVKWIIAVGLAMVVGLYFLVPIIGARLAPAPEPPPPLYVVIERKGISDGYDIDVSIQAQDITPSDIEALARQERRNLVRVFVYRPDQTIVTEKPVEHWEFTTTEGLRQIY
jgi:hypothetical protein